MVPSRGAVLAMWLAATRLPAAKATIDDPKRFKDSKAVAAHLSLTPRVYQSGEIDRSGHVSKCGDKMMRHALYEGTRPVRAALRG